jgi:tetratricopeptide (TPR) repeat protein
MRLRFTAAVLCYLALVQPARAGLHYSGESFAELPSQWRGFLLDQRTLRNVAVKPTAGSPANPARTRYEQEATKLAKLAGERKLSADEAADLGALNVRLGEFSKALEVLRPAQQEHPQHYRLASNLGTAWQLNGDLDQAVALLERAVRLAPGKFQKAEELQLKLVRLRVHEPRGSTDLDDLFGVRFVGENGKYDPSRLAMAERKKLPADAVARLQQVALWLPADGRLLWQLAELAATHGDVATAAAIMDGCVTEFGLRAPDLREHRKIMRAAADELARANEPGPKAAHEGHPNALKPRSSRPLLSKIDQAPLPPIDRKGVNGLPWSVIAETTLDRQYRPTFSKYLKELDGLRVQLNGFMQPLGDDPDSAAFLLIEYPVGCWYCEMPEVTAMVLVELPAGKTRHFTRGGVRITGKLVLNATDPENFLYVIRDAKVTDGE